MVEENYTERLVNYIADTKFEDLDDVSISRAKERLIDSFGVMMIGSHASDTDDVVDLFKSIGGTKESSIATYGIKLPMAHAAFLNSLIMRAYDFEAIDAEPVIEGEASTAAHISGTTVPTALAVGERYSCSGKDLLRALILADDVTTRLLNASGFSVHDYFDGNGTANVIGAATVAGLIMGLTKEELHGAYALAVNQMTGTMQNVFEKQVTFKLPIALSAKSGILAAQLACCGYTPGLVDPIAGPRGYFGLFYSNPTPEKTFSKFGERYFADCVIKPWPSCRATHGSIDATFKALDGKTYTPDEVEKVSIHVAEGVRSFVGQGFEFGMDMSYQGAFSIDFLIATAILYGGIRPEHFTSDKMTDPNIGSLLSKIEVLGDLPASAGSFKANVEVVLKDSQVLKGETIMPLGDYYQTRFDRDKLLEKYYYNVAFGGKVSKESADKIVALVDDLENLDDVSKLMELIN